QTNLLISEWILLFRHSFQICFSASDRQDQQAFPAFPRDQDRAAVTSFEGSGFFIEPQSPLLFLRAMTFVASTRKDGLNIFLVGDASCCGGREPGWRSGLSGEGKTDAGHGYEEESNPAMILGTDGLHFLINA